MTSSDYPARYEAGESLLTLSLDAGCKPDVMRALLVRAGVTIRPKGWGWATNRSEVSHHLDHRGKGPGANSANRSPLHLTDVPMTPSLEELVVSLTASVKVLTELVLRLQRAMFVLAADETLPAATRAGITAALEGGGTS